MSSNKKLTSKKTTRLLSFKNTILGCNIKFLYTAGAIYVKTWPTENVKCCIAINFSVILLAGKKSTVELEVRSTVWISDLGNQSARFFETAACWKLAKMLKSTFIQLDGAQSAQIFKQKSVKSIFYWLFSTFRTHFWIKIHWQRKFQNLNARELKQKALSTQTHTMKF